MRSGAARDENAEEQRRPHSTDQGPQSIKDGDCKSAYLEGENLAHCQISGTGRGGRDKENKSEANAHATGAQGSMGKGVYGAEKEKPRYTIGRGSQGFAPVFVEKPSKHHGTEEAA